MVIEPDDGVDSRAGIIEVSRVACAEDFAGRS
jgi:hypothetical protein